MTRRTSRTLTLMAIGSLAFAILVSATDPGPAPCNCIPGPDVGCALASYLHRHSTVFVCHGEARWGRLP